MKHFPTRSTFLASLLPRPSGFVAARIIRRHFDVSYTTLRRRAFRRIVRSVQPHPRGRRLYCWEDVVNHLTRHESRAHPSAEAGTDHGRSRGVVYARVSSLKQRRAGDLTRQVDALRRDFPAYDVVTDVGSGLNWKRPGLAALSTRLWSSTGTASSTARATCSSRFSPRIKLIFRS